MRIWPFNLLPNENGNRTSKIQVGKTGESLETSRELIEDKCGCLNLCTSQRQYQLVRESNSERKKTKPGTTFLFEHFL